METQVIDYLEKNKEQIKNFIATNNFKEAAQKIINSGFLEFKDAHLRKAYYTLGQILSYNHTMTDDEKDFIEVVGIKKNIKKAIGCYECGMAEGSDKCINKLYNIYYYKQEGLQNYEKALELAEIGAQNGDALFCFRAGIMFHKGLGTMVDDKEAEYYLSKSAAKDPTLGAYELAQIKENMHTKQSEMEAFELYKMAASAGDKLATYQLGRIYMGKVKHAYRFVEKDPITAQKYFEHYLKKEHKNTNFATKYYGMINYENGNKQERIEGIKKIVRIAKRQDREANEYLEEKTSYGSLIVPKVFDIPKMQESVMKTK